MTLSEARVEASQCWMKLEVWMTEKGYVWARGEGAEFITAKDPTSDHRVPGLHGLGLAQDYVIYQRDSDTQALVYLGDPQEYQDANEYWLTLHSFCRLVTGDSNHFSFSDHSIPSCVAPSGKLRK